jgi:tetratricopeptide (TPR) repeat protein
VNLGRALRELGRAEQAETALREAVRLHPKSAPALAELGKALCEREHLADGLAFLEQAVALAPEDYETRYSLAAALFRAKRTPEALREGAQALQQARAAGRKIQAAEIERALEAMKAAP